MQTDLTIKADGSGTAKLEYVIAQDLNNLGRQGGDWDKPIANIDEESFRQTADRLPGLKLLSWKSKKDAKNEVVDVSLSFDKLETLAAFMGGAMSVSQDGSKQVLKWNLGTQKKLNPDLLSLAEAQFKGYSFSGSFSTPRPATLSIVDPTGKSVLANSGLEHAGWTLTNGSKAAFSIPMDSLLAHAGEGLSLLVAW
jgi:hypothetical protein